MFVVALLSLGTPVEAEVPLLAAALGRTAFEARQVLAQPLPVVLWRSPDDARAQAMATALRGRGHVVAVGDEAALPAHAALQRVRDFELTTAALVSVSPEGKRSALPWAHLRALVRAAHTASGQAVEVTRGRTFSMGRALVTQGLSVSKETVKEERHATQERDPVLYLFHSGGPPWLLSEQGLRYGGLGAGLQPVRAANFEAVVAAVRAHAPSVPYDERLTHAKVAPTKERSDFRGQQTQGDNHSAVDLLAHLVAASLTR